MDPRGRVRISTPQVSLHLCPGPNAFDPEMAIVVETDVSDYVSAGVLSQHDDEGVLHPVAFYSKKHSPAECNYEIYDKELLAVIRCFEEWRPHLESTGHQIHMLSEHRNLEYFMTSKLLNRRQARWSEFLSRFNFEIKYRSGKKGGKPDALTRRSGDLPKEGDERLLHQSQVVLKRENLDSKLRLLTGSLSNEPPKGAPLFEKLWTQGYTTDKFVKEVLDMLQQDTLQSKKISLAECTNDQGQLRFRGALYVPDHAPLKLEILKLHHDVPSAAHPGRARTFELISREFYWPKMRQYIEQYLRNCRVCRQAKPVRHSPFGLLKPLPVPQRP